MDEGEDEDDEESPPGKQKQIGLIEMLREQEELVKTPMKEHGTSEQEDSQQDEEQESDKSHPDDFDYGDEEDQPKRGRKTKREDDKDELVSDNSLGSEDMNEYMEDIEEQDEVRANLKMPEDLVG